MNEPECPEYDVADQIIALTQQMEAYLARPDHDLGVYALLASAVQIIDELLTEGHRDWRH